MSPKHPHLQAVPSPHEPDDPQATVEIAVAEILDSNQLWELLDFVSGSLELALRGDPPEGMFDPGEEVTVESFVGGVETMQSREMTAVLYVLAALLRDHPVAGDLHAELARRDSAMPQWVRDIGDVTIEATACVESAYGDFDEIFISARWPSGQPILAMVHADHNLGSVAVDGFFEDSDLPGFLAGVEPQDPPPPEVSDIDPAEARARIEYALAALDASGIIVENETWPGHRPVIGWLASHLPEGGTGYIYEEPTAEYLGDLIDGFLGSDWGRQFATDTDAHDVLTEMCRYAVFGGSGDPYRWTPAAVETFLTMWVRAIDRPGLTENAPRVLRKAIPWFHSITGLPTGLTTVTLEAIDHCADDIPAQGSFDF